MKKNPDEIYFLLKIYFIFLYIFFSTSLKISFKASLIISRYLSKIILFQDDYERFILELNVKGLKNCLRKSIAKKVMLANCGLRYRLRFMVKKNNVGAHVFHVRLEK